MHESQWGTERVREKIGRDWQKRKEDRELKCTALFSFETFGSGKFGQGAGLNPSALMNHWPFRGKPGASPFSRSTSGAPSHPPAIMPIA